MTPKMISELVRSVWRIREPVPNRGWGEGGGERGGEGGWERETERETERERETNREVEHKKRHGTDDFVELSLPSTKMFKSNKI